MLLGGRYRLRARLADDRNGALHQARDERLERDVSIRVVDTSNVSERSLRALEREARILGTSAHPGLARLFDIHLAHPPPFLVFEPLEGVPLGEWLAERPLPALAVWASWMRDLVGAMGEVHRQGFVLRDLSRDAVFIHEEGVKLLGLGAARRDGSPNDLGADGLPHYFAPELIDDLPADPRCDLYSATALGFRMLTGVEAISLAGLRGPGQAIARIARQPPARADALREDVTPALADFLERGLPKSPSQRPSNAADYLEELVRALGTAGSESPPPAARRTALNALDRPTTTLPEVGDTVGHYTIYGKLGAGGMGAVMLARDQTLDRNVAIKFLFEVTEGRERERVLDEARSMARVAHPNIVQVFGVGEHLGSPFIVMEYIPGQTLEKLLLSSNEPLPLAQGAAILEQVATGLHAVHQAGLVHGDVKPSNVLLGPAGRVCVTDFGLVATSQSFTPGPVDAVVGTPEYMAPERARGDAQPALAHRIDVYGLAVLAFETLVGRRPFQARYPLEVIRQHVDDEPPRPSSLRPSGDASLDASLDALLLRGLNKDPASRQADCLEFRTELLTAVEQQPSIAQPRRRLLIVDDDPDFCLLLKAVVLHALPGCKVDVTYDGTAALEALEAKHYDLVLLDLALPDMNAVEVTATLKATLEEPPPVMVITGAGTAADWQVLSALGVRGFHLKPITPDVLTASLRHLLGASA